MIARLRLAPVSLAALLAGCATTAPTAPPRPTPMPIVELKAEPPPPPARLEITAADVAAHSPLAWRERVGAVYRAREGEPLFLGDGPSLTADGVRAIQLAANAWSHGIPRPADWGDDHVAALQAWIDARDDVVAARRLEVALLLRLMQLEQAQRGRLTQIDADRVPAPLPPRDLARRMVPSHEEYEALRAQYARLRHLARAGALAPVDGLPGWTLRLGRRHASVPAVRHRLAVEGFGASGADDPRRLDRALRDLLRRYQYARGLDVTGRLDGATQAALRAPPEELLRRLELGLARWHLSPARHSADHLLINVPSYEVQLVEGGRVAERYDAVVGKTYWRTPVDQVYEMGWIVVRPVFFGRGGGEIPIGPGPRNPLGELAIRSTDWSDLVYLHGTNRPELFRHPYRTYSRGCIRLRDPVELAARLVERDPGPESAAELRDMVAQRRTEKVRLAQPVTTFFEYNTTFAAPERDVVVLARDVYRQDERPLAALRGAPLAADTWR